MRPFPSFPAVVALAVIAAAAPPSRAATECKAEVRATEKTDQVTDEAITKVYAVEVDTDVDCAKVYVDFTVTERLFTGEEITSKHRGWRKISSDGTLYRADYRIAKDTTVKDWKFEVFRCVVCGTE